MLANTWHRLINPPRAGVTTEQRRQARLLALLMLGLGLTSLLSNVLMTLAGAWQSPSTPIFLLLAVVFLALLYWINDQGHYRVSARLFVGYNFLVVHLFPLLTGELSWLLFGIMVMLLGAILLPGREVVILFFASVACQIFLLLAYPMWVELSNRGVLVNFFVIAPMVLAFLYHRARLEAERRQDLEQQVLERTQELEAARLQIEGLYQEQLKVSAELRSVDRMKSQFLASMSHELRTPLNAILNFSEFMRMGLLGPVNDKQTDALDKVLSSSRHLLSLINDVLDMTKIQAGLMILFVEENIDLAKETQQVLANIEPLLADRPVRLILDIDPHLPPMLGDRRRIRQILLNLLSNAAKFTEEGSITLSLKCRQDEVLIMVSDTGPGIAPADHERIFEAFIQTDKGREKVMGTGLGLPISRKLAESHGGRLWLESDLGEGAAFFVTLPIQSETLKQMMTPPQETQHV
jgi:signal transduction histidine kinase